MYIFKNALLSIKRNKGRNLLIGIIILAISCASAVTLAIKNSATTLINSYKNEYQVEASIGVNRESLMKNSDPSSSSSKDDMKERFSSISSITEDDVINYGTSDYVTSYYYTNSIGVNSNIEKATSSSGGSDKGNMPEGMGETKTSTSFTLTGYSSAEAMTNFIEGSYSITSGEISSDFTSDTCVINSELATYNNLSVGDTITIIDPNDTSITYTLTITGIYADNSSSSGMSMFSNSVNNIITNNTVVDKILGLDSSITNTVTPTFVLTSSDVVDAFTSEIESKGLNEYLSVTTNLDEVSEATSSISSLSTYATTFLIITLIIGAVVLLIINMINIRERKYEIGVLRTIGMKKSLVAAEFIIELLVVAIASMIIGTGLGAVISVPTANKLLANEISSSSAKMETVNNNFGHGSSSESGNSGSSTTGSTSGSSKSTSSKSSTSGAPSNGMGMDKVNGVANVKQISSINAVVDFKVVLELLLIGIGITLISATSAIISIQKFSPLTILKERS